MSEIVKNGLVKAIKSNSIDVEIISCSACAGCAISSSCSMSETKKRIVTIQGSFVGQYQVGDKIEVVMSDRLGLQAVVYAFVIPLLLLLITVVCCHCCGFDDIISGISGIIVLIPYYFALFLNRNRLENKFCCRLKKQFKGIDNG